MADTSETAEDTGIYEEMKETAQALQELAEKLKTAAQDGESYQTGKATDETQSNESVQVSDSAPGELKQSNSTGPGGGSNAPPGGLAQLPTSLEAKLKLDVKLEAEAVQGFEANKTQPKDKEEEEVSRGDQTGTVEAGLSQCQVGPESGPEGPVEPGPHSMGVSRSHQKLFSGNSAGVRPGKEVNYMSSAIDQQVETFQEQFKRVREEVSRVIVGYDEIIDGVIMSLLANGHVLLEGVPGLGKTKLVSTLSDVMHLKFSRIQFTPDLMPADITGTNIVQESGEQKFLQFQPGPIFANIVLADEVNRATPKTQSALLEAMEEETVTVGKQTP